jgi:chorismate mutase
VLVERKDAAATSSSSASTSKPRAPQVGVITSVTAEASASSTTGGTTVAALDAAGGSAAIVESIRLVVDMGDRTVTIPVTRLAADATGFTAAEHAAFVARATEHRNQSALLAPARVVAVASRLGRGQTAVGLGAGPSDRAPVRVYRVAGGADAVRRVEGLLQELSGDAGAAAGARRERDGQPAASSGAASTAEVARLQRLLDAQRVELDRARAELVTLSEARQAAQQEVARLKQTATAGTSNAGGSDARDAAAAATESAALCASLTQALNAEREQNASLLSAAAYALSRATGCNVPADASSVLVALGGI